MDNEVINYTELNIIINNNIIEINKLLREKGLSILQINRNTKFKNDGNMDDLHEKINQIKFLLNELPINDVKKESSSILKRLRNAPSVAYVNNKNKINEINNYVADVNKNINNYIPYDLPNFNRRSNLIDIPRIFIPKPVKLKDTRKPKPTEEQYNEKYSLYKLNEIKDGNDDLISSNKIITNTVSFGGLKSKKKMNKITVKKSGKSKKNKKSKKNIMI